MKYQVTFMERTDAMGDPSEDPTEYLDMDLPEDLVLDAVFVQRLEPSGMHNQEVMDEDDSFLSVGTEVWEYDIADGRDQEFIDAVRQSRVVIDVVEMNEMMDNDTINTAD